MEKLPPPKPEASSTQSTGASKPSSENALARKELILRCQRMLFAAYRTDQYADPDGFMLSLGMVLEQYPNDVVVYVCNPRTGVQRDKKWPPAISEIVEACDRRVYDKNRTERFKNWGKTSDTMLLDAPQEERPTREELKAKYGENWGMTSLDTKVTPPAEQAPSWDAITAMYQANPSRIAALTKRKD